MAIDFPREQRETATMSSRMLVTGRCPHRCGLRDGETDRQSSQTDRRLGHVGAVACAETGTLRRAPRFRHASLISMADLVQCHRRVLESSVAIVGHVSILDLERPTPCIGWTLRQLLAHMVGQNYGFAAAADGTRHDRAVFADRPVGDQPAAEYATSALRVIEAFGVPALIEGSMYLPEVRTGVTVPAPIAIGFHLVDYVAHGWDVARTVGIAAEFDEDALQLALTAAQAVPAEAKTLDDQTPFRPSVPTISTSLLDRILAALGRSPDWAPPT